MPVPLAEPPIHSTEPERFSDAEVLERISRITGKDISEIFEAGESNESALSGTRDELLEEAQIDNLKSIEFQLLKLFNGKSEDASRWMNSPKAVFGGQTPNELAQTESGAKRVETLIYQLEHGVYV